MPILLERRQPASPRADDRTAPPYPVNLTVNQRRCLVVGGGKVALRKTQGLVTSGAKVTVVAPQIVPGIFEIAEEVIQRAYEPSDLADHWLVITCTDQPDLNSAIADQAEAAGIWVNSADDPSNCTFTLKAIARRDLVQVTVSTHGASPALATWLRDRFQNEIDSYGELTEIMIELRQQVRATFGTSEIAGWIEGLDAGAAEAARRGDTETARAILAHHLGLTTTATNAQSPGENQ